MLRLGWRAIAILAFSLGVAVGNWNDTSTGLDLNKLPQFPLTKIRSGWLKDGSRLTFDGISASAGSARKREVVLRGKGKSGKPWEAHLFGLDEVWRGDLDDNGTQDYVLFASGPYFNGRTTPLYSLSVLLMDQDGLPVPFFTVVYKGENGDGIKHLVDLNHDGHAELLINNYDEATSDPRVGPFCSGHWVTQLYMFKDPGVEEFRGAMGGIRFPFVYNWTYGPTECAALEKPISPIEPPAFSEQGTSVHGAPVSTIRHVSNDGKLLAIAPVDGCEEVNPSVIVYDRLHIREIEFPSQFSTYGGALANEIRQIGAKVELRGLGKRMNDGTCAANLLWAK